MSVLVAVKIESCRKLLETERKRDRNGKGGERCIIQYKIFIRYKAMKSEPSLISGFRRDVDEICALL
jgi:hypothetical protein